MGVYPLRAAQLLLGPGVAVAGATLRDGDPTGAGSSGEIVLVSRSGVLVHLEFGFDTARRAQYSVWGSTARLSVERAFTSPPSWRPEVRIDEPGSTEQIELAPADQCVLALATFASAVRGEVPPPAGPEPVDLLLESAELMEDVRERAVRVTVRETAGL